MTNPAYPWHLLGAGRVGTAMARILLSEERLGEVWTRTTQRAEQFRAAFPHPVTTALDAFTPANGVIVVAVPDDALGRVAEVTHSVIKDNPELVWLHTSGVRGPQILRDAGIAGHCGTLHPLQSLSGTARDVEALEGAFFAVDGDAEAVTAGEWFAGVARGVCGRIGEEHRAAYHLAAVIASNGLYGLLHAAQAVCERAGIDSEALRQGLATLARHSATSARVIGTTQAATGPVVRGDVGTLERHREWIAENARELDALYTSLADQLLVIAEARGLPDTKLAALNAALHGDS